MTADTPNPRDEKLLSVLTRWGVSRVLSTSIPDELFHYTDAKGLLGIIQDKSIWASSVYYLNDASEVRYGSDLLVETLDSSFHDVSSQLAQNCFESLRSM